VIHADPDATPFDVCGPLPTGITVLEASAGTGKTYTIAGLAARYVAEGTPLDRLLIVTFTRNATSELRDRVRERLVSAEQGLADVLAGAPPAPGDDVLALLADGEPASVAQRQANLAAALADFDAATIVTTHGFCQEVLEGLGIAGDLEPDIAFVDDVRDLVSEIVDDLYVRRFHAEERAAFDRAQALEIADAAVRNPTAPLEPTDLDDDSRPAMRRRLAERVRIELETRKRRRGIMTYDDLLTRLADALSGPGGDQIAKKLRARYGVVLVDEFQDTDPTQWDIMRRAFDAPGSTLVLIGDPKQAIYAFRGADVYAYLAAKDAATAHETLDVNWRSDGPLITAYDGLFGGAQLGHPGIAYRSVHAAPVNRRARLAGAPHPAPLRIRVVPRAAVAVTARGYADTASAREHIARDLAADLVALLASEATIETRDADGQPTGQKHVQPGDVAVLVRRNADAELVRAALEDAGVPAVLNGAGSVFATDAAAEWLTLLEALERPSSTQRARAAAYTGFVGWSAERIALASEEDTDEVHALLHGWARLLRARGVAALSEAVTHGQRVPERLLARLDGERRLTDLRHIGQLLHAAAMEEDMGVAALTGWLRKRIAAAADEGGDEERSRRLESDAQAVQVLTIHRSKGLEFPIVYLPYLWHPTWQHRDPVPVAFHEDGHRRVDVGLEGRTYNDHKRLDLIEQRGEDLRLAYVGLTRARHQAIVWWAPTKPSADSPLGRLVFSRGADGAVAWTGTDTPSDADATARFEQLAATAPGCIAVERSALKLPVTWSGPPRAPARLTAATFDRSLDVRWRRTSYSGITAAAHEAWVASEPEEDTLEDEGPVPGPGVAPDDGGPDDARPASPALPLAAMPSSVHVGSLLHDVFESVDFAAGDLDAELSDHLARAMRRRPVELGETDAVVAGLRAAIETPLGPLVGDQRLRDIARADRLDELTFEMPLVGGDTPTGQLTPAAIAAVLRDHLGAGDPLAGYAERLEDPVLATSMRGYLTGSIDCVLRTRDAGARARFSIVDYKTNRLTPTGAEPSAHDYAPPALNDEMQRAHYPLQALLYSVALHRYLRWRVGDYQPARDLGGVLYLFVRGMVGPDTPRIDGVPCGVFSWRAPDGLIPALSDVLDRGAVAA
jgi:exodeoxyribonuclease V beta subunit